jgi:hypothetical protein
MASIPAARPATTNLTTGITSFKETQQPAKLKVGATAAVREVKVSRTVAPEFDFEPKIGGRQPSNPFIAPRPSSPSPTKSNSSELRLPANAKNFEFPTIDENVLDLQESIAESIASEGSKQPVLMSQIQRNSVPLSQVGKSTKKITDTAKSSQPVRTVRTFEASDPLTKKAFYDFILKNLGPGLAPFPGNDLSNEAVAAANRVIADSKATSRLFKVFSENPSANVRNDPAILAAQKGLSKDADRIIEAAELGLLLSGTGTLVRSTASGIAKGAGKFFVNSGAEDFIARQLLGIPRGINLPPRPATSTEAAARTTAAAQSETTKSGFAKVLSSVGSNVIRSVDFIDEQTVNLSNLGTAAGLYYFLAKAARGEIAVATTDSIPNLPIPVSTLFNEASAANAVGGSQGSINFYTTKKGSTTEADGFFVATANGSVGASKIFNVAKLTKDIAEGKLPKTAQEYAQYIDAGKINAIAQSLQNPNPAKDKKQIGGGLRGTVGSLGAVSTGVFFGIRELNTRSKITVNLASVNATVRAMKIRDGGKPPKGFESAGGLLQAYLNLYSAIPTTKNPDTGKLTAKEPAKRGLQYSIQYQLGGPLGTSFYVTRTQPSKLEGNIFLQVRDSTGKVKKVLPTFESTTPSGVRALSFTFNGNKYSSVYDPNLKMERVFKGEPTQAIQDYLNQQSVEGNRFIDAIRSVFP